MSSYPQKLSSENGRHGAEDFSNGPPTASQRRQYSKQIGQLQELFPGWQEDDLLSVLDETRGDLETAVARISEGHAEQWGAVKTKKDKKPTAPSGHQKDRPRDSAPGRGGFSGRGGRGGSRGGRGGSAPRDSNRASHQSNSNGRPQRSQEQQAPAKAAPTNGTSADAGWDNPPAVEQTAEGSSAPAAEPVPSDNAVGSKPLEKPSPVPTPVPTQPSTTDASASKSAQKRNPLSSGMSWAQVAKPVVKPPAPAVQPAASQPGPPAQPTATSTNGWEDPATVQAPVFDDEPQQPPLEESPQIKTEPIDDGWITVDEPKEPSVSSNDQSAEVQHEPSVPAPVENAWGTQQQPPQPSEAPVPPPPQPTVPQTNSQTHLQEPMAPPPGLASPSTATSTSIATPKQVYTPTSIHGKPSHSQHRSNPRYKSDQPVILPGQQSSLSGISFGGASRPFDKLAVQFGNLNFDETDAPPAPEPKEPEPIHEQRSAPTQLPSHSPAPSHPQTHSHIPQQQPKVEAAVSPPSSSSFTPLTLPSQGHSNQPSSSPRHPSSLHQPSPAQSQPTSQTSTGGVFNPANISSPSTNLPHVSQPHAPVPNQASGLGSSAHSHNQSYGGGQQQHSSFHHQAKSYESNQLAQGAPNVGLGGLGSGAGGPQSQNYFPRHQESPFYGQSHNNSGDIGGYAAGGGGGGSFTPVGGQSQGGFGGHNLGGGDFGYDGPRGLYDNYSHQSAFSARGTFGHDDIKSLGSSGLGGGSQGGQGPQSQGQYGPPINTPYSYYGMNAAAAAMGPYYAMQNQYYGAPSPGYGQPFNRYPHYGGHQQQQHHSGMQTPPHGAAGGKQAVTNQYSSSLAGGHVPSQSYDEGYGTSGLSAEFQKYGGGGGAGASSFLGGGGVGSTNGGQRNVSGGPGASATSPESSYKPYGGTVGSTSATSLAEKSGVPAASGRGVGQPGSGVGGGNFYQGASAAGGLGGAAAGAGRFGNTPQTGSQYPDSGFYGYQQNRSYNSNWQ